VETDQDFGDGTREFSAGRIGRWEKTGKETDFPYNLRSRDSGMGSPVRKRDIWQDPDCTRQAPENTDAKIPSFKKTLQGGPMAGRPGWIRALRWSVALNFQRCQAIRPPKGLQAGPFDFAH